jgi:hypothetical protein
VDGDATFAFLKSIRLGVNDAMASLKPRRLFFFLKLLLGGGWAMALLGRGADIGSRASFG